MKSVNDWLSADISPNTLGSTGVRRVNNLPLFIALGILTLFVVMIALVAVKRAALQQEPIAANKPQKQATDSLMLAKEIIGDRHAGIIPSANPVKTVTEQMVLPIALVENPDAPPLPSQDKLVDTEIERIRQDKIQQFEEAVKAKTNIEVSQTLKSSHLSKVSDNVQITDTTAQFQARLQEIQAKPNALTLGGAENEQRWVLHSQVENPTRFMLRTGSVIPGTMISGIRSDLPGQIIAQVAQNVYDTATGKYLLFPQGTKLYGLYSSDVSFGQDSLLIAWQRIIFPDGRALDIGSMPGTDSAGMAGFRDKTNHHYVRIFGSALLMSGIVAGITYSQNQNEVNNNYAQPTAGSVLSQALGQQLGEVTAQMIAKNLNIAPSLEIGSGYPFNIIVTKDLVLEKPYREFDY